MEKHNKINILWTIPSSRAIRMFIDTPIFKKLAEDSSFNIYVIHGLSDIRKVIPEKVFQLRYPTIFKPIKNQISQLLDICPSILGYIFADKKFWIRGFRLTFIYTDHKIFIKKIIKIVVALCLWPFKSIIARIIYHDSRYTSLIKNNSINIIISSNPVYITERTLSRSAELLKVPFLLINDGWDTFQSSSYKELFKFYGAIVTGNYIKKNAIYRNFSEKQILVSGLLYAPLLEKYYSEIDVKDVREKYRIPQGKKVILMFYSGRTIAGQMESIVIEKVLHAIETNNINNAVLLFRLHPNPGRDDERLYKEKYKNNHNIIFQTPSRSMDEFYDGRIHSDQFFEVAQLFKVANVFINFFSNSLIEASIVKLKSILIDIETDGSYPFAYVSKSDVYSQVTKNKYISVAKDFKSLFNLINSFLKKDLSKEESIYRDQILYDFSSKNPEFYNQFKQFLLNSSC